MPNQPPSFRFPFALPQEVHPAVKDALRLTYQGVVDLNQAIKAISPKVNAAVSQTGNTTAAGGGQFPTAGIKIPKPDSGSGSVGMSSSYSREDHVHPFPDSTTGSGRIVFDSTPTLIQATFTGTTTLVNLQIFANNAAAVAGGLTVGNLYRTGADPDILAVVH